jgi:hypothetical protein
MNLNMKSHKKLDKPKEKPTKIEKQEKPAPNKNWEKGHAR